MLALLLASPLALLGAAAGEAIPEGPVPAEVEGILAGAVGSAGQSPLVRVAQSLPGEDLVVACYRGTRAERLVALSAAAYAEPGRELMPYLVALTGTRQRETASRAAGSLLVAIERMETGLGDPELVPGQARQLAEQCLDLARDPRLASDLRIVGLDAAARLSRLGGEAVPRVPELFDDPEHSMRAAALALLDAPLDEGGLALAATMASSDPDPVLRGQAAGLLCENALAHEVTEPSADLARVLREVAGDDRVPSDGLAPLLGCLVRFPSQARAGLVERILARDAGELRDLWKALEEGGP